MCLLDESWFSFSNRLGLASETTQIWSTNMVNLGAIEAPDRLHYSSTKTISNTEQDNGNGCEMLIGTISARLIDTFSCDNVISFWRQFIHFLLRHLMKCLFQWSILREDYAHLPQLVKMKRPKPTFRETALRTVAPRPRCNIYGCSLLYTRRRRVTSIFGWGRFGDWGLK